MVGNAGFAVELDGFALGSRRAIQRRPWWVGWYTGHGVVRAAGEGVSGLELFDLGSREVFLFLQPPAHDGARGDTPELPCVLVGRSAVDDSPAIPHVPAVAQLFVRDRGLARPVPQRVVAVGIARPLLRDPIP